MPVYRIPGKRSGVYALAPEVDAWLKSRAPNGTGGDGVVEAPLPPRSRAWRPTPWAAAAAALLLAIALLSVLSAARSVPPQLSHSLAITNDGLRKAALLDGGRSLFFVSSPYMHGTLRRISESGGEASVIPFPSNRFDPLDVSRDGSRILVRQDDSGEGQLPLWVIPTAGGPPRRLADLCAGAAAWSPDESKLAYTAGRDLYLGNANGSNSRRLVAMPFDRPHEMRWSPDGKRIRLVLREGTGDEPFDRLWEVNLSAATANRVLPGWSHDPSEWESGGEWTPDGRFFIFAAAHRGTSAIWAVREKRTALEWREAAPIQLTAVQEILTSVTVSQDGKRVFADVDLPPPVVNWCVSSHAPGGFFPTRPCRASLPDNSRFRRMGKRLLTSYTLICRFGRRTQMAAIASRWPPVHSTALCHSGRQTGIGSRIWDGTCPTGEPRFAWFLRPAGRPKILCAGRAGRVRQIGPREEPS